MFRKSFFLCFLFFFTGFLQVFGQTNDLSIGANDIRIELKADGGVHLFIRKKPDINSVLLTETTRDPEFRADNFAYRAAEWNPVNGDEIRILDGEPIPKEDQIFSLISSTIENHPVLGEAFHIYIPWIIYFGYADTRNGAVVLADGTYLNIRAFSLRYGDYRGSYLDNPFILRIIQREDDAPPEGKYAEETVDSFREIAATGGGSVFYSRDPDDISGFIKEVLEKEKGNTVDLVLCLDTTGSMRPHLEGLKRTLIPMIREMLNEYPDFRLGSVFFRDYGEEYLTRVFQFSRDFNSFQRNLNSATARGGGDIPEAVYEGLYDGATRLRWENQSRIMILAGDAPPHPKPRGRITKELLNEALSSRDIKVSAVILPE